MELVYHLSEVARRSIFVETGENPGEVQVLKVDPAALSRQERMLLIDIGALNEVVNLRYWDSGVVAPEQRYLVLDEIVTDVTDLLERFRVSREAGAARAAAQDAKRVKAQIERYKQWSLPYPPPAIGPFEFQHSPQRQQLMDEHAAACERASARASAEADKRAREQAESDAEKARRLEERRAWVREHGSPYLQKCIAAGYDCQREYAVQRAALEYPDYQLDFDDRARWNARSGPTEAALDEAARVGGSVVWITRSFDGDADREYEAVVVSRFLGRYDLIKEIAA